MSFLKSAVIQGDFWERTRLVRIGAFSSVIARKFDFHSDQSSFGSFEELRKSQLWLEISVRKTECLKCLKLPQVIEVCPLGRSKDNLRYT